MTLILRLRLQLFLVFTLWAATEAVAQPVPIDLGTLGGTFSTPTGLNDSGHVVGYSWPTGNVAVRGFVWTETSGMVDLGALSGANSIAFGVNNEGQVVGASNILGGARNHAFLWTAAGGMVDLGGEEANAVNDLGQIVGSARSEGGITHAVMWTPTEGMVDLGTLGGVTQVTAVNNSGQVIGHSRTTLFGDSHAFLWTATSGMVDLTGATFGDSRSGAGAINNSGHVVGQVGFGHAFLWTPTDGIVDLGGGGASAVNDLGQVVGIGELRHAAMWTVTDGRVDRVDLGTLGGTVSYANDVNEQGQVVGQSQTVGDAANRAFVWTAADGMVELAPIPGKSESEAKFVNNSGQVVGISWSDPGRNDAHATMWVLPTASDLSPPTLLLPATIVVDGTSPAGATVTYSVAATDDVDPNPFLVCSPASGSVFPFLATTVTCTATDDAGNGATGTFQVVVLDASQQLQDTIDLIANYDLRRLGTSLTDKLQLASRFSAAGDVLQACAVLTGFLNQVDAQTGKALTVDQATELTVRAIRIRNVIGC